MSRHSPISLLVLAAAWFVSSSAARAQITTDAGASIVLLPVVIAEGSRDTIVELTNASPQRVFVRCVYTSGRQGGGQEPLAFDLMLLARQPTHWTVSSGRVSDPLDPLCSNDPPVTDCDGAGLDAGRIPALSEGFEGDLLCTQIDRSHAPMSGNALRAVATLLDEGGEVAKYAGIGLAGAPGNDGDGTLCLGGSATEPCPRGAEYAACPRDWLLNLRADGSAVDEDAPTVRSRLVLATCSRRSGSGSATVQIRVTNELEQSLSTSLTVQRRADIALADLQIFAVGVAGSEYLQARIGAVSDKPGVAVVALSERVADDGARIVARGAAVPHAEGAHDLQDRVLLAAP